MLAKKNVDEIKRNERAKKKARFLEKKVKVTRRVILSRIVNLFLMLIKRV